MPLTAVKARCTLDTMDLEPLRELLRRERKTRRISQEAAAELVGVSVDRWKNLECSSRRTAIRLPQDRQMLDQLAGFLGRASGEELLKEAGLL